MIDLSILICSVHTRWRTFAPAIQEQVWGQYEALTLEERARLEIIMLTDNKQMMLGQKRNVMVDMAQGRYVQFVDDDDRIEPDMFASVLEATASDADVVTFLAGVSINGAPEQVCRYSTKFRADRNVGDRYERIPNHICAVKRELALMSSFPNLPHGEDAGYSKLLLPHLKTEHAINRVLYHYDYSDLTTEAQESRQSAVRLRARDALVDVVVLSNAATPALRRMTQRTIDTCLAGANSLPVNVIVLEQQRCQYHNATTVHAPGEFNYNGFANRGAEHGTAEWLMVANNDLVFGDGWLHELLAADHSVVSPKSPTDPRQADVTEDTLGDVNGRHFSGWCFMVRREVWERIGGFDTDVSFWCSDDATIEQVKAIGLTPKLVVRANVRHVPSSTLKQAENRDDLTWKQVDIFNRKYGRDKFAGNASFEAWKARNAAPA